MSSRGRGARGSWARRAPSGGVGVARARRPETGSPVGCGARVVGVARDSGQRGRASRTALRARPVMAGGMRTRPSELREERGRRRIRSGRWRACARGPQGLRPRPASAHSSASYRSARWRCRWASPSNAPTTAANHPARPRAMTEPPPRVRGGAALLRRPGGTPTCSNPRVPAPGAQARSPERRAGSFPPPPDVVFAHPTGPERGPCRPPLPPPPGPVPRPGPRRATMGP